MILLNNPTTMNSSGQSNESVSKVCGDLLSSSAWSAVIHQPAHDSDLEDLPSTVDMDAIKNPISTPHNTISSQVADSSESDSESESESEKEEKYCTKKFGYSSVDDDNIDDSSDTSLSSYMPWSKRKALDKQKKSKDSHDSSSSSSDESSSSSKSTNFPIKQSVVYERTSSEASKKKDYWQDETKKTYSSSSDLDKLESIDSEHLQVINQEDLAEILSDVENQNFSNCFDDVQPKNLSDSSDSSDTDIKDQVVNDAIIRLDNTSEDETEKPPYSSKLLEEFVEKTEGMTQRPNPKTRASLSEKKVTIEKQKENLVKRGRGRPKGSSKGRVNSQIILPKLSANFKRGPGRPKKMPPLLEPNSPTVKIIETETPKKIVIDIEKKKKKHKKKKKKKKKHKKPASPKFIAEMENLVALCIQCLNISKIPDSIRGKSSSLKSKQRDRSSKKRKLEKTSYSDNDIDKKRKKGGSPDTSRDSETTNDQRLPLKKRHYHITSSTGIEVAYLDDVSRDENSGSSELDNKRVKPLKVKSETKKKSGLRSNSAIPEVKTKENEKKEEPKPKKKPPAGIFVPTVEMPSLQLKKKVDDKKLNDSVKKLKTIKSGKESPLGKLKKRKKCINRTGFPMKKKKKKRIENAAVSEDVHTKLKVIDTHPTKSELTEPERRSSRAVVLNKLKVKKKDEKEDSDASNVSIPKKVKLDQQDVKPQKKKLDKKHTIQSWNYRKLKTNVYYDFKPVCTYEAQTCNCKVPTEGKGCTDDCLNRMIFAECSQDLCPCKEKCSNQRLQKHEWAPGLVKFMTEEKGWGIKTTQEVKNGELLLEYVGEVVSEQTFKDRMTSIYKSDVHHYCLKLDGGSVIDGHRMGGEARFVNHSCEPNCEMQKWSVNGLFRMALFALRDIQPDEELCYDYNFSLFNPDEGQSCKCNSPNCRGVIGGKSQRILLRSPSIMTNLPSNRNRSRKAAPNTNTSPKKSTSIVSIQQKLVSNAPIVINQEEKELIFLYKVCLYRNIMKIDKIRAKRRGKENKPKHPEVFRAQMNALTNSYSVRTRRLATAQNDPEMEKKAKLATIFKQLYDKISNSKEETGELLATPFVVLPSKRKFPSYYQKVQEPIDLMTIGNNIESGAYDTVMSFDSDILKLLTNNIKYYGRTSDLGVLSTRLRKIYNLAKVEFVPKIEEILEKPVPEAFIAEKNNPGGDQDDVVRCICGLHEEEGLMIQCERCLVWQHCDCIKADPGKVDNYLCERCDHRQVDYEIPLPTPPSYAESNEAHYLTLMREDLQVRVNDTVYVLRDIVNPETGKSHSFKTIKHFKYSDCDIFRVEKLWKNEGGERFSFGHHYLRPHETYHEPTRKFYPNEVVRVPIYEKISLDLIMGRCWVLDPSTYSKGYPIGADHEHLYICEYRVDKGARMFAKMNKSKNPPICTKSYAFEKYDQKLKLSRTFAPHGLMVKVSNSTVTARPKHSEAIQTAKKLSKAQVSIKKQRLDTLLLKLLSSLPEEDKVDMTYLLEPGRRHRKKPSFLEL
ncbi:histone-lysine N-methyltransferase ASH1L [Adelges cooleyi]|uniref:histone-lysine N-methyltransferase ASH1L n=1 Tax=Adelges cooleyi TaxID=133065 RepID=UPI00217FB391|nr:histone-lysine N-methyltransferase ASH1L [Adelges cooleyi]XP_050431932.1 histone-lysine N-methyltransferase ASH1L [Adelges cooleyi]XP_050431933.1 histone-lysine N-methyltransferase ASH1L [Adelges cooleyi]